MCGSLLCLRYKEMNKTQCIVYIASFVCIAFELVFLFSVCRGHKNQIVIIVHKILSGKCTQGKTIPEVFLLMMTILVTGSFYYRGERWKEWCEPKSDLFQNKRIIIPGCGFGIPKRKDPISSRSFPTSHKNFDRFPEWL